MVARVPKFEEIQTFNHDGKTYHVRDLNDAQLELLQIYVSVEDEIFSQKMALARSQHALNSVSGLFKDALVDVPVYVSPEEQSRVLGTEVDEKITSSTKRRARRS